MDYREFEATIKEGDARREETYKQLTDLLDTSDLDYKKIITILDWFNAQAILGLVKDEYQALRCVDLLNNSTKKLIRDIFKKGLVSKEEG